MIKKYNQFVKSKINEDFTMAPAPAAPEVKPDTEVKPGTEQMPKPPSPFKEPSPVPAPAKAHIEEEEEEEGNDYIGRKMINQLANHLGTEVSNDGSIDYNGKKINFYSETEMFHVDRKKFKTPEEVVNYLEGSEEMTPEVGETFESKSYRNSRKRGFRK